EVNVLGGDRRRQIGAFGGTQSLGSQQRDEILGNRLVGGSLVGSPQDCSDLARDRLRPRDLQGRHSVERAGKVGALQERHGSALRGGNGRFTLGGVRPPL